MKKIFYKKTFSLILIFIIYPKKTFTEIENKNLKNFRERMFLHNLDEDLNKKKDKIIEKYKKI